MKEPRVPLAKEGYPFMGLAALAAMVCALAGLTLLSLCCLLITTFICYFFRDPDRVQPLRDNVICSPADGRVLRVEKIFDNQFLQEDVIKVSIFMNVFDVHVNRAPLAGSVLDIRYRPGLFFSADTDIGGQENEHCALVIGLDGGGRAVMVQIAGLIARRIVCWAEKGDILSVGQRVGLIRFGSRVDLYLPASATIEVKAGQRVRAGETILGVL